MGYPVGVVRKVVRHPGSAFAQVAVDPAAHMDRGRLVMLVWQDKDNDSNTATHMQVQDKTKDKTQKGRL
nr:hypothetical protein [Piscirickettsia salmonis]